MRAVLAAVLLLTTLAGCLDGPDALTDVVSEAASEPGTHRYGPYLNGTHWRGAVSGPVVILWTFEGVGSCTVDVRLSGAETMDPGAIGVQSADGWSFVNGGTANAGVESGGNRTEIASPLAVQPTGTVALRSTHDVDGAHRLLVASNDARPGDRLRGASIDALWFCTGDVELVSVEGSPEVVYWGVAPPENSTAAYAPYTTVQSAEARRDFTTPSVRLLTYDSVVGRLELDHPDGTESYGPGDVVPEFVSGPGDHTLRTQRVGFGSWPDTVVLAGLRPLEHLDDLLVEDGA